MKTKENKILTILLPITILTISLIMAGYIDYKYATVKHAYILEEGELSSTTFMMENDAPYAVTFKEEKIGILYVPEKLEHKAAELLSEQMKKENTEYIAVTCRIMTTERDTRFIPVKTTYQLMDMETLTEAKKKQDYIELYIPEEDIH